MDVGSWLSSCLHTFFFIFELWDVLGGFVSGWLCLEFKTSCPDFWPVRSSGDVGARAGNTPIQFFLCRVVRSSGDLAARAGLCEFRSSVEFGARAEAWFCKSSGSVYPPLERDCWRSSRSL